MCHILIHPLLFPLLCDCILSPLQCQSPHRHASGAAAPAPSLAGLWVSDCQGRGQPAQDSQWRCGQVLCAALSLPWLFGKVRVEPKITRCARPCWAFSRKSGVLGAFYLPSTPQMLECRACGCRPCLAFPAKADVASQCHLSRVDSQTLGLTGVWLLRPPPLTPKGTLLTLGP